MSERHIDTLEFFVSNKTNGQCDGTLERPFPSLGDALTAIEKDGDQFVSSNNPTGKRNVEIVFVDRAGGRFRPGKKPRYQFYVDTRSSGEGDGTELSPWPSLRAAMSGLLALVNSQKLTLRRGQRLCVTQREVFTPTEHEKRKKIKELVAKIVFLAMALVCVLPVVAILGFLTFKAWPALSWEFVTTNPINYFTAGGIWSPLIGTFCMVLLSLVIAAPIGVLAGVYLNEYARDNWITRIINLAVVNLAGVPSIVHALFGVGAFVLFFGMGRSLLAASCTVAVMTLPVIITSTREALASVPMSFREACWNMGASRWQTIRTIVLPNSIAGVLTGVILQVARAAGETAPILFTGAVLYVKVADYGWESMVPYGVDDRFMALSYHLFALSTQIRGAPEEALYGTAVVLIGLVLVVNSLSIGVRVYLRSRKKW